MCTITSLYIGIFKISNSVFFNNLIILSALKEDQVKVCFFVLVARKPIDIDSKI